MKKDEVYHLKLLNGHDIICKYVKRVKDVYTVSDVMIVEEVRDFQTGSSNLFLNKYTLGMTSQVEVDKSHVIIIEKVNKVIEDYYNATRNYADTYLEPKKYEEIVRVTGRLNGAFSQAEQEVLDEVPQEDNNLLIFGEPSNEAFLVIPTVKTVN